MKLRRWTSAERRQRFQEIVWTFLICGFIAAVFLFGVGFGHAMAVIG